MSASPTLHLLSAGAAKGLAEALIPRWRVDAGGDVRTSFGAVGTIRGELDGGAPCDVILLTAAMIDELAAAGRVHADSVVALGRVRTGVAVRAGDPHPPIGDATLLAHVFGESTAIYVPDLERSTAGIHFARVLKRLGIHDDVAPRLHAFPNGAKAMAALAAETRAGAIGCTQVTEIRYTPGVELVGVLPPEFELATVYAVAVSTTAGAEALARRFVRLLAGPDTADLRESGGFEA